METNSALLELCELNSPFTCDFHQHCSVTPSFDVFFDLRQNKRVDNRGAGDFRRHRAHYEHHCCAPYSKVTQPALCTIGYVAIGH